MGFIMKNYTDNQLAFNNLLSWFLSKKSKILDKQGEWAVDMVAKNISVQFLYLKKEKKKKFKKKVINIKIVNKSYFNEIDKIFFYHVKNLQKNAKKLNIFVQNFLIHGSFATLDYQKGWSDLDTLVILKEKSILEYKKLKLLRSSILNLEKYLYKIDPLQHHGFIFITNLDLSNYHSAYLPMEVLHNSLSLTKSEKIKINYYRDKKFWKKKLLYIRALFKQAHKKKILLHHPYNGIFLKENFQNLNAMYQMKYFLSLIMILPCIYLDAIGKPAYKKYSFNILKNNLEINDELIKKATNIRNLWPKKEKHPFKNNRIPKWLIKILGRNYFKRALNLVDELLLHC
tara:strand:+ start:206 stop:1234 length:1029 start_codon:yes stop_codon:yes gene_type:complete